MRALYCAQLHEGQLAFFTSSGEPVKALPSNATVLVSRLDCDVRVLKVPPVSSRDVFSYLRYQLRTLYPGNPSDTQFDYRLSGEAAHRTAVVYIMKAEVMRQYRRYVKTHHLVTADIIFRDRVDAKKERSIVLVRGMYVEYLRYRHGVLAESSVLPLNGRLDLPSAFRRYRAEAGSSEAPLWVSERQDDPRIAEVDSPSVLSLSRMVCSMRRGPIVHAALFRARRRTDCAAAPAVAALLAIASVGLLSAYLIRLVDGYRRGYEEVRAGYERLQSTLARTVVENKKRAALETQYRALLDRRPLDVYRFLSRLSQVAAHASGGHGIDLQSVSLVGAAFTIEGQAVNPFGFAQSLSTTPGFSSVRIMQATPLKEAVQFTLTGRYHDR